MKPLCVYHNNDLDGVCSAAIVKHFVPECELYGIDYGQEFPWNKATGFSVGIPPMLAKRKVYLVDFSLDVDNMDKLNDCSELIWIDHHKTAIDACDPAITGLRDTRYAACELCWTWFDQASEIPESLFQHADTRAALTARRPEAIRLLGAYDSWRRDDPETMRIWDPWIMPFQYGCRAIKGIYDPECCAWGNLCWLPSGEKTQHLGVCSAAHDGNAILGFQRRQDTKVAEAGAFELLLHEREGSWKTFQQFEVGFYYGKIEAFEAKASEITDATMDWVPRLRCICLNTPVFNSQAFEAVYDTTKHDIMVAFAMMANRKWKVSLYTTKPEIDCGAIAKTFGGGGHKKAAGFVCDDLPWREKK